MLDNCVMQQWHGEASIHFQCLRGFRLIVLCGLHYHFLKVLVAQWSSSRVTVISCVIYSHRHLSYKSSDGATVWYYPVSKLHRRYNYQSIFRHNISVFNVAVAEGTKVDVDEQQAAT